jgi:hypothetical protein
MGNITNANNAKGQQKKSSTHHKRNVNIVASNKMIRACEIEVPSAARQHWSRKVLSARYGRSDNPDMLHAPQNMAADTLRALTAITEDLQNVPDIVALVLGGSYARSLARPDSDLDIGFYYREKLPFSVDRVRSIAESICTPGTVPVVTQPYDWGPW